MNEKEKELLENFRGMSAENQINMLTYAYATRSAEIAIKRQYRLLPESNPENGFERERYENLTFR
jgi:hypothetical protein